MVKNTWYALRKRGFTLVEIVVAMSIFTIGVMALGLSLAYSMRTVKDSVKVTTEEHNLASSADIYVLSRSIRSADIIASRDYGMTVLSSNIQDLMTLNGYSFGNGIRLCRLDYSAKKKAAFYVIELIRSTDP